MSCCVFARLRVCDRVAGHSHAWTSCLALPAGQAVLLCGHSPCLVWSLTPALGSWATYTLTLLPLSAGADGYFAMSQRVVLAQLFAKGGERGNNICIFKQIP